LFYEFLCSRLDLSPLRKRICYTRRGVEHFDVCSWVPVLDYNIPSVCCRNSRLSR
jgi:hypothetical protein